MKYELNKLDDKFNNKNYFSRVNKKSVKEFSVKDFLALMISNHVSEIGDYNYFSKEILEKIIENFSHELIVTTMNNLQYAYMAYKYNHISADMFTHEKEDEWFPIVEFTLMLNYVFNPFHFEHKLEEFEKKFPHLDFHFELKSNLWDSRHIKMKDFQRKYKIDDVILEDIEKNYKNKENYLEYSNSSEDVSIILNLSSMKTDNELLNFIKHIDFNISGSDDEDWKSDSFQHEAIEVLSKEINKRNLSSAISWNVNFLTSSMFEKSHFSIYHARCLSGIRFILFLGESIKDNKDFYLKYFNYVNDALKKDVSIIESQSFHSGYASALEDNIITALDFTKTWEEPLFINNLDKIFKNIDNYEKKIISLNRKKSQFSNLNEEIIIAKIKEVIDYVKDIEIKEKASSLLSYFETKDLNSFNGKVNLNLKKSLTVEIDLDNLSIYQIEKFNNKLKKSEVNGYFSKIWKIVSNILYPEYTNFPSEIRNNSFVFVNYEHPDIKMSDEELRQWTEKVVEYIVNKDFKEKHSSEVIEAELQKVLMQYSLLLSENKKSPSKPKVVKF